MMDLPGRSGKNDPLVNLPQDPPVENDLRLRRVQAAQGDPVAPASFLGRRSRPRTFFGPVQDLESIAYGEKFQGDDLRAGRFLTPSVSDGGPSNIRTFYREECGQNGGRKIGQNRQNRRRLRTAASGVLRGVRRSEKEIDNPSPGLAVPVPFPQRKSDFPSVAPNQVRRGVGPDLVPLRHLAGPVMDDGERDREVLDERSDRVPGALVLNDQENGQSLVPIRLMDRFEGRQLLPAERSPRVHEVEKKDLSGEVFRRVRFLREIGEREIRGRLAVQLAKAHVEESPGKIALGPPASTGRSRFEARTAERNNAPRAEERTRSRDMDRFLRKRERRGSRFYPPQAGRASVIDSVSTPLINFCLDPGSPTAHPRQEGP